MHVEQIFSNFWLFPYFTHGMKIHGAQRITRYGIPIPKRPAQWSESAPQLCNACVPFLSININMPNVTKIASEKKES